MRYLVLPILALLAGCAGTVQQPTDSTYRSYYGSPYDGGLRTDPCRPFNADALTRWAKALGSDRYHHRAADITVHNGTVNCRAHESAGSRQGRGR